MATAMNGAADGAATQPAGFDAFCELQAAIAANDYVDSCRLYAQEHPEYSHPNAWQDFLDTYVEYFRAHFEAHTSLNVKHLANSAAASGDQSSASVSNRPPPGHSGSSSDLSPRRIPPKCVLLGRDEEGATNGETTDPVSPFKCATAYAVDAGDYTGHGLLDTKHNKSFMRRFSFKVLRNGVKPLRHLFKQRSHESQILPTASSTTNGSGPCENKSKNTGEKNKFTKIIAECRKEGIVHQLTGEDSEGKSKWEKCRLMLVKTTGGDMLEFYIPPKVRFARLPVTSLIRAYYCWGGHKSVT